MIGLSLLYFNLLHLNRRAVALAVELSDSRFALARAISIVCITFVCLATTPMACHLQRPRTVYELLHRLYFCLQDTAPLPGDKTHRDGIDASPAPQQTVQFKRRSSTYSTITLVPSFLPPSIQP